MDPNRSFLFQAFLFMLMVCLAASATIISDSVFSSHGSGGRHLLQNKKPCTMSFEFLNYTIITSKCKGPQYPVKLCCDALKEFACPYAEEINDGSNDCATTMFTYINFKGKYPTGLFATECKGGKDGLLCPNLAFLPSDKQRRKPSRAARSNGGAAASASAKAPKGGGAAVAAQATAVAVQAPKGGGAVDHPPPAPFTRSLPPTSYPTADAGPPSDLTQSSLSDPTMTKHLLSIPIHHHDLDLAVFYHRHCPI